MRLILIKLDVTELVCTLAGHVIFKTCSSLEKNLICVCVIINYSRTAQFRVSPPYIAVIMIFLDAMYSGVDVFLVLL